MKKLNQLKQTNKDYIFMCLLAIFLHQTTQTSFANISLVDVFAIYAILKLIKNKELKFTRLYLIIVYILVTYILFLSFFYAPYTFDVDTNLKIVLIGLIKKIVLFLYFYLGRNIFNKNQFKDFFGIYAYSAVVIGILGIVSSIINIPILSIIFFNFGNRLNGFMNDPNYFAILQVTALPYFVHNKETSNMIRILGLLVISFSVLLSASKTGFITLVLYLLFIATQYLYLSFRKKNIKEWGRLFLIIIILLIFIFFIYHKGNDIIKLLNYRFPIITRITNLITNFETSVSGDGSARNDAWKTGLAIVQKSPFLGIGVGNYTTIGKKILGIGTIAHNSYIQTAVELGMPVAIIFYSSIFMMVIIATTRFFANINIRYQRDILLIFMIGSIGISLNNARFFWLVLGVFTIYYKKNYDNNKQYPKSQTY